MPFFDRAVSLLNVFSNYSMLDYKIAPCFCPSLMNMRRKLVCGLLVNSQIFYFWSIVFIRILALVVLPFALAFGGSLTLALPAPLMQLSEQVTEKSMALDYDGAMALAKKVRGSDDGVVRWRCRRRV